MAFHLYNSDSYQKRVKLFILTALATCCLNLYAHRHYYYHRLLRRTLQRSVILFSICEGYSSREYSFM